ncbi:MAG: Na+/H+ antiporter subunit E [Rubrimonas sp.]
MLTRLFPHPHLTIMMIALWMLLLNSWSLGGLVLGAILGAAIPLATAAYWPDRPRIRSFRAMAGYLRIVLWDIVIANIAVARIILFRRTEDLKPAFFTVPLDLRSPEAITLLAGTITMTPGTVSAEISADGRALLVHALDAPDPDAVRDEIKSRYEARIKEIFE